MAEQPTVVIVVDDNAGFLKGLARLSRPARSAGPLSPPKADIGQATLPIAIVIRCYFRAGKGPIPGAYSKDGKDHRLSHRHRHYCARGRLLADETEKKLR
jgi:hypothetical protein